ncbi:MAG: tRNA (guanine(10)-N(2))-dimethyltransferase, partial [Candidatus Korarchaeota archaeon]|nr:tRNA (guanine(10)-N(2))-dimethyltransferase [Candidatus Korarchaeota archaeon]
MQEGYKWVREGKVSILAPDPGLYRRSDGVYEPAWAPVFYNPRMVFNRDMAILVARALFREGEWVFAEPLAGTGVRSVRLLVEAGARYGVLNDLDPRACRLAARNLLANGLGGRAHVYCMEASLLLRMLAWSGMRFDYVDIDPFGSPMPFVEAALLSLRRGGILAVTATDTAPLSGTHPQACLRRYQARP